VPPTAFSGRELAVMQDEEDDDFQGGLVELPDPPATADAGEVIYPDADVQSEDTEIDEEAESALHADTSADWSLQTPTSTTHDEEDLSAQPPTEQVMGGGRWPARDRAPPKRLAFSVKGLSDAPRSIKEAMNRPDWPLFQEAISTEMCAMTDKQVYDTVAHSEVPQGQRVLQSRMLLNIKRDADGRLVKYKARLVARGDQQSEDLSFEELFAPTAASASFRALCARAAKKSYQIQQIDVSTAYLNADLLSDVYVRLPTELGGDIWRLKKALYGLRQAAKQWNEKLSEVLLWLGFQQSSADPCLFFRFFGDDIAFMLFHVDDAVVVGTDKAVSEAIEHVATQFKIKQLGEVETFLGIQVHREGRDKIILHQSGYAERVVQTYGMMDSTSKPVPIPPGTKLFKEGTPLEDVTTYRSIVGSLNYLAVNTRPDLSFVVSVLSRFMQSPTEDHLKVAKHALRYLRGTKDYGLVYNPCHIEGFTTPAFEYAERQPLMLYADADFAGEIETRKSTTGYILFFVGCPVLWKSGLQTMVATSTTEAEFIAAATAVQEALWFQEVVLCLTVNDNVGIVGEHDAIHYYGDNEAALHLIRNHTAGVSGRSKHIDVKFKFLRDRYMRGDISVHSVSTTNQVADCFTKAFNGNGMKIARARIGVSSVNDKYKFGANL
jgi:hypothetical protein